MNTRQFYKRQRWNAGIRNIPWELTFVQWLKIWVESRHLKKRGKGKRKFVMARFGDKGPYAPDNVKIITNSENVREGNLGNKHRLGKKHSAESLAKMMGKKHSPETRAKISATQMGNQNRLGKRHSAETKTKISATQMGNQNWLGKKHSTETRAKISAALKGNKNALTERS